MTQDMKYSKTQEKQFSAWVTFPGMGIKIPGSDVLPHTCKQAPFVIYTAGGVYQPLSFPELAAKFRFSTGEAITDASLKSKMKEGVLYWTEVKRVVDGPGAPLPVFARHIPGKAYGGLGYFMVCPDMGGYPAVANTIKIRGDVFVSTYNLRGFPKIATREQSATSVAKPAVELAVPKVAPVVAAALQKNRVPLNSPAALLEMQLRQAADILRKNENAQVKLISVRADKDGTQKTFYRGDIEYKFSLVTSGKPVYSEFVVPVAVMENAPDKANFRVLSRGETYGVPASNAQTVPLAGLVQPLVIFVQDRALAVRDAYKVKATASKLLPTIETVCATLSDKVVQLKYTPTPDGTGYILKPKYKNNLFGSIECIASEVFGGGYRCIFRADILYDTAPAVKALNSGAITATEDKTDIRSLASAIVGGFGKLKKAAEKIRDAELGVSGKKDNYDYRLVGRGKNEQGEQLYVLERLTSGARTTMNRNQLIKLLEEKRVENAYVRWYKEDRQIRLRGGGSVADVDVGGLRRSSINRIEGAKAESEQLYSEVIKSLSKKGYSPDGDFELTDEEPLYGTFAIHTPELKKVTAMFSVTEWKYGATDGGQVSLKGMIPEENRRRSMLASSLVSLIQTAGKGAVASTHKPTAPIIPAQDDDFTNVGSESDDFEEAANSDNNIEQVAEDVFSGLDSASETPQTVEVAPVTSEAEDAFAELEDAPAQPVQSSVSDSPILSKIAEKLYDDAINTAMTIAETAALDETADGDVVSAALDEVVGMRDVFIEAKDKLEAMLSGSPDDVSIKNMLTTLNDYNNDIQLNINNLEQMLRNLDAVQQLEQSVDGLHNTAVLAAGVINTRTENTPKTATVAEVTAAINEMTEYKLVFDTAFEEIAKYLDAHPSNAFVKEKFDDISSRDRMNENNFNKLDELLKNAQEAELKAVVAAQEQETALKEQPQAAGSSVEEDPFAGLGDDIEEIFRALPGEIVSEGKA